MFYLNVELTPIFYSVRFGASLSPNFKIISCLGLSSSCGQLSQVKKAKIIDRREARYIINKEITVKQPFLDRTVHVCVSECVSVHSIIM